MDTTVNFNNPKKRYLGLIWLLLWLPISQIFPEHGHFPISSIFSPIIVFFAPFSGGSQSSFSFDLQYIYLPAAFFWGGGIAFVCGVYNFLKGKNTNEV